jgi:hypothetical protein
LATPDDRQQSSAGRLTMPGQRTSARRQGDTIRQVTYLSGRANSGLELNGMRAAATLFTATAPASSWK